MDSATAAMANANHSKSCCPSTRLARVEPAKEPARPAPPNTRAQDHFTRPALAWANSPTAALAATAAAEVPSAM